MEVNPFEPSIWKAPLHDTDLADPSKPGGPSDYSDPNPVDPEHVLNLMRSNFPEKAIDWVKRTRWVGPIQVPWERIDTSEQDEWVASQQPAAVARFAKDIKAGTGHTNPSILVQDDSNPRAVIIDGHHRALAHHRLGQPVLAYLGSIDAEDREAAEATHDQQVHSGADPRNKDIDELLAKLDDFWFCKEVGKPVQRKEVFKILAELRDAGRDERLLTLQARDFGWSITQIDNPFLRAWLCDARS